ncbi:SDR family oxidoreductase [Photobacterium sp. BZF1]|nr:SDR family oxidoreductase [Photobacterium sp. BZF1]
MVARQQRILVAGSTGYLGLHLVKQLQHANREFTALARSKTKLLAQGVDEGQIVIAEVTSPIAIKGCCDGIDVVISCLGITKQQDGLGYMDVDYQANLNLLLEAERAGVEKFIYVSAFKADKYSSVRLLRAKERFAKRLLSSEKLTPCVIRPNGFFSDIEEVYRMAEQGRVYLFARGEVKVNPIHGEDLAKFCLEAVDRVEQLLEVGGPEVLSARQIAERAFHAQEKMPQITYLPDWLRRFTLIGAKWLPERWGGPAEFFLTMMAEDSVAPRYGKHLLVEHFSQLR